MRRLYAVILMFPLMSLLGGAVWVPLHCPMMAKTECPLMGKMNGKCMMTMAGRGGEKGKGEEKGKTGCGYCTDCPLCYLVTFKSVLSWEFTQQVKIIDYTVISDNNLHDYSQQQWKPPNGCFLS